MRRPQGWFEWVKLAARMVAWAVIVGFIGHWIYNYDRCLHDASSGLGKVGCLGVTLFATYLAWWLLAVIAFWYVVNLLL